MSHEYFSPYRVGNKVLIDGDRSIVGVVTALLWRAGFHQVEVCWFSGGAHQSFWFDHWRLTAVDKDEAANG